MLVRTDEVAVLEVEAVQLVASRLGVHHVLIDNECGALCVVGDALADLAGAISVQSKRWKAWKATYRTGPNLPKRSKSSSGVTLKLAHISEGFTTEHGHYSPQVLYEESSTWK